MLFCNLLYLLTDIYWKLFNINNTCLRQNMITSHHFCCSHTQSHPPASPAGAIWSLLPSSASPWSLLNVAAGMSLCVRRSDHLPFGAKPKTSPRRTRSILRLTPLPLPQLPPGLIHSPSFCHGYCSPLSAPLRHQACSCLRIWPLLFPLILRNFPKCLHDFLPDLLQASAQRSLPSSPPTATSPPHILPPHLASSIFLHCIYEHWTFHIFYSFIVSLQAPWEWRCLHVHWCIPTT